MAKKSSKKKSVSKKINKKLRYAGTSLLSLLLIAVVSFVLDVTGIADILPDLNDSNIENDVNTGNNSSTQGSNTDVKAPDSGKDTGTNNNSGSSTKPVITDNVEYNYEDLRVHFIDVDQADCIFIECGGEYMLIDGGNPETGDKVVNYLISNGVSTLKYYVGTHPHADHIGCVKKIFANFEVENAIKSKCPTKSQYEKAFLSGIENRNSHVITPGMDEYSKEMTLGNATFKCLTVDKEYDDVNAWSIVILLTYKENKFVFTGDAIKLTENDILATGVDIEADVLKVGHHGSYTSSGKKFVQAVNPAYAVIMCGENNDYGHPHAETVATLEDEDIIVYRTDKMGTIVCTSDGKNLHFTAEKVK
ncbi:MAG: MBL fold metallo-hydrolase [Lachnospiraceae bacterium]|nr:MBL fold metallo-hydrolase [Lachnospiraceae bacterium]